MKTEENTGMGAVTFRSFVIGFLLSGFFAWVTVILDNIAPTSRGYFISGNLLPVLPHLTLLVAAVMINPLLKRLKFIRLFNKSEILLIFVMCAVSAGVASWGLTGQLIPKVAAMSNKSWNTDQSSWDINAMPFLNENYFISQKGTQAAAKELREVHLRFEKARDVYQAAKDLELGKTEVAKAQAALEKLESLPESEQRAASEKTIRWTLSQSRKLLEGATERWSDLAVAEAVEEVIETYPDKIEELKLQKDELREELKDLNKASFDAVEEYRKGLPPEKRSTPGFFYMGGEGLSSYRARFERFKVGGESLEEVKAAKEALAKAVESGGALAPDWGVRVKAAADMLKDISDIPRLSALHKKKADKLEQMEDDIADKKAEGRRLRQLRRYSTQKQFEAFNDRIDELDMAIAEEEETAKELRSRIEEQISPLLDVCERVKAARTELVKIADDSAETSSTDYPALQERLEKVAASFSSFDATARRFWLGDARWRMWLRPLLNWIFLAFVGYVVIITVNVLIFRQWAHNEKLIYPLAEVATILACGSDSDPQEKSIYRSGLFWIGFCIAFGVLGWNYLANNNILPNINAINLQFRWYHYVGNGIFRGWASTYFCIIFVVIGVSFLVPSSISFSLWFFEFLYMCLLLVMVWLGYGNNRWALGNVGRSGIGSGAMLVFGLVILWTCRRYLLCVFKPADLKGLPTDEAKELRVCSLLFIVASIVLILMLSFGLGANLFFVTAYFLLALIMAIALIRAVAEGGVLGIESFAHIGGIMKAIFGVKALFAPILLAPAAMFWSLFFGGMKAFMGPMVANSLKVREKMRIKRWHFHGAIWAGILIAVLISVITLIMISYERGADNLHGWMNAGAAKGEIRSVAGAVNDVTPFKANDKLWMLTGAALMGGLLFARRRIFGIPHPIGLLMIMNSNMFGFWGSILIGWGFKSIVSKYCSQEQYVSIRRFFIGLVLGHMTAILLGWDHMFFHWG